MSIIYKNKIPDIINQEVVDELINIFDSICSLLLDDEYELSVAFNVVSLFWDAHINFQIEPSKHEVGKLIGRDGSIIIGTRTILESIANKYKLKVNITIKD